MRIFRGPQNQVLTFKNVNETGIALNDLDCKIQNPVESLMKSIGAGNAADALVQNIYMRIINRNRRGHSFNPSGGETACPIAISDRDNKAKLRVRLWRVNATQLTAVTQFVTINMQAVAMLRRRRHWASMVSPMDSAT